MSIYTLHSYTVDGAGQFPFDMLRHDECWPQTSDDVARMFRSPLQRSVKITGITKPNVGRWNSFGWRVTEVK